MRRENKRVIVSLVLTSCMVFTTEFGSIAAETQSEAQAIKTINHETKIAPLAGTWNQISEEAEIAVETQEWYGKALANTNEEADVVAEAADGSSVIGKMYNNTILTVEERGEEWSRVSSGSVQGYVRNEMLAFGSDAVERAKTIDMSEPKAAKTLEEIAAEEAARKREEEKRLMAAIIYCEAGNQPHDGKVGVGAVIMNRVRSGRYPNSIEGVIYQPGQFGPAMTGKLGRVLASGKATPECYQAAEDALNGHNPIGSAMSFGNGNYGQLIGDHYFH